MAKGRIEARDALTRPEGRRGPADRDVGVDARPRIYTVPISSPAVDSSEDKRGRGGHGVFAGVSFPNDHPLDSTYARRRKVRVRPGPSAQKRTLSPHPWQRCNRGAGAHGDRRYLARPAWRGKPWSDRDCMIM